MFRYFVSYSYVMIDGSTGKGNLGIDTKLEVTDMDGVRELEEFILNDLGELGDKVVIDNYIKMGNN